MDLRAELASARVLAIARGGAPDRVVEALGAIAAEGIVLAEVSLSDPRGLDALRAAAGALGDELRLGAGTVLSAAAVEQAADAGATFIVTPAVVEEVAAACARLGLPIVPGAQTPTEVLAAAPGAAAVKLFPGGLAHLRALRGPFPDVPFVPVGGIGPVEAGACLEAGALAVGVGTPLFGDALAGGDLGALRARARALLAAVT